MADAAQQPYPNIHPEMYVGVCTLSLFLATLCVGLRFYVRFGMIKSFGRDDWVLLAAYVGAPKAGPSTPS